MSLQTSLHLHIFTLTLFLTVWSKCAHHQPVQGLYDLAMLLLYLLTQRGRYFALCAFNTVLKDIESCYFVYGGTVPPVQSDCSPVESQATVCGHHSKTIIFWGCLGFASPLHLLILFAPKLVKLIHFGFLKTD